MYGTKIRSSVQPASRPVPARGSVVLFDASHRRRVPSFGIGILRSLVTERVAYTAADAEEAAQMFAADLVSDFDRHLEEMYEASAMQDRYDRGSVGF